MVNKGMTDNIREQFPFLTGISYSGEEYLGIIINHDAQILSFYDIGRAKSAEHRAVLLELGETWWWESNRMLPIDVFLRAEMRPFRYCLRTLSMKDTQILFGPTVCMQDFIVRRIKRRSIQLVRRTD
jgi:hypothetical protein